MDIFVCGVKRRRGCHGNALCKHGIAAECFVAVDGLITGNLDGVGVFTDFFIDGFETDV